MMKSHFSVTWMETEWLVNGDCMMTGKVDLRRFQSPFSPHSVDWMVGTFQWPFTQLIFWKLRLRPMRLEPGMYESKGSALIIWPLGPLGTGMKIWYLFSVYLILYFLIFYYLMHSVLLMVLTKRANKIKSR